MALPSLHYGLYSELIITGCNHLMLRIVSVSKDIGPIVPNGPLVELRHFACSDRLRPVQLGHFNLILGSLYTARIEISLSFARKMLSKVWDAALGQEVRDDDAIYIYVMFLRYICNYVAIDRRSSTYICSD